MKALSNKTILFSGVFEGYDRTDLEMRAVAAGAKLLSGVTKNLDYLLAGEKMGPQKKLKAAELGVPVITLQDFLNMLGTEPQAKSTRSVSVEKEANTDASLKQIEKINWSTFKAATDLQPLRDLLQQIEKKQGVTDLHKKVSDLLLKKTKWRLQHNYGHKSEMVAFGLSPDGKYFATGSWVSDDYEAGGDLMVWEVASGRCIRTHNVDGGLGWPDYADCIQWSADGSLLGISENTNAVGVYQAFSPDFKNIAYAGVTDGYSRPAAWALSPDNKMITVSCHYGKDNVPGGKCLLKDFDEDEMQWFAESWDTSLYKTKNGSEDEAELHPMKWTKWSPDGKWIYGASNRQFYTINAKTGDLRYALTVGSNEHAAVSSDETLIAMDMGGLSFYSFENGTLIKTHKTKTINDLIWASGKKNRLAVIGAGIQIYDNAELLCSIDTSPVKAKYDLPDARQWAFSPDGESGACLTAKGIVLIWSISNEPQLVNTIQVKKDARGIYWGAGDILVAVSGSDVEFINIKNGETLNAYTFDHGSGVSIPYTSMSPLAALPSRLSQPISPVPLIIKKTSVGSRSLTMWW